MKNKKANGGFTLIELLVVVLIIAILAAVALPQYNKAVKKAQGAEVLVALDTLDKAFATYALEKGFSPYGNQGNTESVYASELSVEIPTLKYFKYTPTCGPSFSSEIFQKTDPCVGVSFTANAGDAYIDAKWDNKTGHRLAGTYCAGANCQGYFRCVSESVGRCITNNSAPDKEHCPGGVWVETQYCYLN